MPEPLDAGSLSEWVAAFRSVMASGGTSDVPCGSCTACCRSSQFVHIEPDETETLRRIPSGLLFPAPGRPDGHKVLPYGDDGACPMLGEHGCSVYEHRPRTCRSYDCRVFAAAGVAPDQPRVAEQVVRWRFSVADEADRRAADEIGQQRVSPAGGATARALGAVLGTGPG